MFVRSPRTRMGPKPVVLCGERHLLITNERHTLVVFSSVPAIPSEERLKLLFANAAPFRQASSRDDAIASSDECRGATRDQAIVRSTAAGGQMIVQAGVLACLGVAR